MNYQRVYNEIVNNRIINQITDGYTEIHHITPKCLGGSNNPLNLVKLTAREHFICHYLLTKIHPHHSGIASAVNLMLTSGYKQDRYTPNSILYENARKHFSLHHPSKTKKGKNKIRIGMLTQTRYNGTFFTFPECSVCDKITFTKYKICKECKSQNKGTKRCKPFEVSYNFTDICLECNKIFTKVATPSAIKLYRVSKMKNPRCSKKCINKNLSSIAKKTLAKLSQEELKQRSLHSWGTCDHVARGKSISIGKLRK